MLYIGPTVFILLLIGTMITMAQGLNPANCGIVTRIVGPCFLGTIDKNLGKKKLGCLKTIRIPDFSQVEEDTVIPVILHQADSNGRIWYGLPGLPSGDLK